MRYQAKDVALILITSLTESLGQVIRLFLIFCIPLMAIGLVIIELLTLVQHLQLNWMPINNVENGLIEPLN